MGALLPAVVPVAFIVLVGFFAGRVLSFDLESLSRLTLYVLVPALIFDGLYDASVSLGDALDILAGFALTHLLLYLVILGVGWTMRLHQATRKSLLATTLFSNSGNLGLPLVLFVLGQEGLERGVIYFIASSLLMFGLGPALLKGGGLRDSMLFTLKLPLVWALLAGLVLRSLHVELPLTLGEGVELMGQAAIPAALLTLGAQMSRSRFEPGVYEGSASLLRLLGGPLAAYMAGQALGLDGLALQVLVLQSATPTAVNAFVMASQIGGDVFRVAKVVVVSTVLSFLTIPAVLWALSTLS